MSQPTIGVAMASIQVNASSRDPRDEALSCEEILREILQYVQRPGEHTNSDLLNAALVNKFFMNPSLDALWETMYSLGPFISLLDCLETTGGGSKKLFVAATPATQHPLFMSYANRLRELRLDQKSERTDTFPILSVLRLARLQPNTPIFPLLRRIIFASPQINQMHAAYNELTALSPVTALAFTGLHTETTSLVQVLSLFPCNPNPIQDLTLHLPRSDRFFSMRSMQHLQHFTALRSLSIVCSSKLGFPIFELMGWICNLNLLQTLKISIEAANARDTLRFARSHRSKAESIRHLHLAGPCSFIQPTVPFFIGVSQHIELKFNDTQSDAEQNNIVKFVRSLNRLDMNVTIGERPVTLRVEQLLQVPQGPLAPTAPFVPPAPPVPQPGVSSPPAPLPSVGQLLAILLALVVQALGY